MPFFFDHDMGAWPNSGTGSAYGAIMGQEELQAWILSAGIWSHSGDNAWPDQQPGNPANLP